GLISTTLQQYTPTKCRAKGLGFFRIYIISAFFCLAFLNPKYAMQRVTEIWVIIPPLCRAFPFLLGMVLDFPAMSISLTHALSV
ncbi:MAG: hypothetical protein WC491_08230, partial [Candidatus Omnitrophota bacterium]